MTSRFPFAILCLAFSFFINGAQTAKAQKPSAAKLAVEIQQAVNWTEVQTGIPKGKIENFTVEDKHYNRNRGIWVYTPPNYSPQATQPYGLLLCFDGEDYLKDIPAPTILDNLLAANKIPPVVAVMIDNSQARLDDLANHAAFADFMGDELLPWVRKNWRVTTQPDKTVLCGFSAGGLASAYVAFKRPELFGNVISQSGAFWRGNEGGMDNLEWLTQQYKNSPKLPLRFYIEVGALETGKTAGGPVFIEANRRFRQALELKGYDLRYTEVEGAKHEAAHWRLQLADALMFFFGKGSQMQTH
jgi:enterochelin esterase family protein